MNKIEQIKYVISQFQILNDIAEANSSYFLDMLKEANSYEKKIEIRAKKEANIFWCKTLQDSIIRLQKELIAELEQDK